ncbi:MAG: universal stress protein [Ilumatobacteraceae bacterium]
MGSNSHRRIVVGVDGSRNSAKAVDWAVATAGSGDTVVLLSAWSPVIVPAEMAVTYSFDDTGAKKILDDERARVADAAKERGVDLDVQFETTDPRTALLGAKADTIVIGARGHGGVMGLLLGSVADYVARHSKVPVVIVPSN